MVDIKVFMWGGWETETKLRLRGLSILPLSHPIFRFLETTAGGQNFYFLFSYPTNKQEEATGDVLRGKEKCVPLR